MYEQNVIIIIYDLKIMSRDKLCIKRVSGEK